MLSLKTLTLSNFITYSKQCFNFDELFKSEDILLIYGKNHDNSEFADDNGAGKSIIYEALCFVLFNRTTKNSDKNRLVGKHRKSMFVECTISDENNEFWIKRYRKSKSHGNDVRFKIDGVEVKKSTQTNLTNFILDTLGISYRRVINTSIFEGNDERSRLVYLGDKEGKALLQQIKGLDVFLRCEKIAKKENDVLIKRIGKFKSEIDKKDFIIGRLKKETKENKELSENFKLAISQKLNRIKKEVSELRQLIKKEKRTKNVSKELELVEKQYRNQMTEISDMKAEMKSKLNTIKEIKEEILSLHSQEKNIGVKCKHCGGEITKQNLNIHVEEQNYKIKEIEIEIGTLAREHVKKLNKSKETNDKVTQLSNENLERRNLIIEEKTNRDKIGRLNKEYDETKNSKNVYREKLNKLRKELLVEQMGMNKLNKKVKEIEDEQKFKSAWVTGFGREDIQSFALRSTVEELNTQIDEISEMLTDSLISISLETEKLQSNKRVRNIFEFDISSNNKSSLPFKLWNKGHKKRIEVIVSFALMNIERNLMREVFLDELFDGIDEVGIGRIKNLLQKEVENKGKRFIVFSHSKGVKSLFNNKAFVRLKDGESKLIQ